MSSSIVFSTKNIGISNNQNDQIPTRWLFGIPVAAATMQQSIDLCHNVLKRRQKLQIGVINAAKVVAMMRDPHLFQSVTGCDIILADGMSVVVASRFLKQPLPQRVPGIDLFENLLALGNEHGYSVYFLGATQEVLEEVVRRVKKKYPNLSIAGYHNGYYSEKAEIEIAHKIQGAAPDMLFVAMTSPKKEKFMARWGTIMNVKICHGVGGSFDVMAGKVKRAPKLWQKVGLEWLYRVLQEPGRMWKRYLFTNTMFIGMLIKEFIASRLMFQRAKPAHIHKTIL
jgi:N-acetylglucosaminyldiphosphoundecaprenol N-acetyl-beta-D-mannosaminyltransferase